MKKFAQLLEVLALTPSRNHKIEAMTQYFASTPDPDRGYALAILTGALSFKNVKPTVLRDVVIAEVDPHLFALSYDYVGDLGETIALIWPHHGAEEDLPSLSDLIELLDTTAKGKLPDPVLAMASGWMSVKQRAKQSGVELPLVISDHADWNELRETIRDTGASTVWVTHGREDALVYWCKQQGLEAEPLRIEAYDEDEEET